MRIVNGQPEYKGAIDVIGKVVKNEGFFALWKGFTPYYMRLGKCFNWDLIYMSGMFRCHFTMITARVYSSNLIGRFLTDMSYGIAFTAVPSNPVFSRKLPRNSVSEISVLVAHFRALEGFVGSFTWTVVSRSCCSGKISGEELAKEALVGQAGLRHWCILWCLRTPRQRSATRFCSTPVDNFGV